ncbi:MAG: hypothetical protein SGJ27_11085 [Candidatus Melainabacteria bacterium]|nr:hypothetical protein [Candidatus Melainabacteria bacterium]
MSGTRTLSVFGSVMDWFHELVDAGYERKSDRQRLAQLAAHKERVVAEHSANCKALVRSALTDQDRDNYLRGDLLPVDNVAEKHNRETVNQWLHTEEDVLRTPAKYPVVHKVAPQPASSQLNYQIKETRLMEFTDIAMGMDKDCLSTFIGRGPRNMQAEQPARSTRELMNSRRTVKDMPAMEPPVAQDMNFGPLEKIEKQMRAS